MARVEPPAGDDLFPGEEIEARESVRLGVAKQRLFEPAEGVVRNGHGDWDVDADHPDLDLVFEASSRTTVIGEDRRPVAVRPPVDEVDAVLVAVHPHDGQHRSEDFVEVHLGVERNPVNERRTEPEPVGIPVDVGSPAVNNNRCAVRGGEVNVGRDFIAVLLGHQRSHVARAPTVSHTQR